MKPFFHSVNKVIFLDGDDVRRAPMAAALFKGFARDNPLLSLWHTEALSAGSGKFTVGGASPDKNAKAVMSSLGVSISSHRAHRLTQSMVEESSIVLALEAKHLEYAKDHVCVEFPSYRNRIITFFDYLDAPDLKFDILVNSDKVSDYLSFAKWMEELLPRLVYQLRRDTYLPLLAKGKGLGSAVVNGPAKIVTNASQAQEICAGDVVVCVTNQITEVFGRGKIEQATAIVTDSASEMSQLSELSYELNIPCVAGTGNATQVVQNEQQVVVDTTGGLVYGSNQNDD